MTGKGNDWFEKWEAEQMQDPEFRAAAEELEPGYQVARLRIRRGLTQKQLAKLVGTKQSSIARLESGKTQPRTSFLRRVVEALGGRLDVRIVDPLEEKVAAQKPMATQMVFPVVHVQRISKDSAGRYLWTEEFRTDELDSGTATFSTKKSQSSLPLYAASRKSIIDASKMRVNLG